MQLNNRYLPIYRQNLILVILFLVKKSLGIKNKQMKIIMFKINQNQTNNNNYFNVKHSLFVSSTC